VKKFYKATETRQAEEGSEMTDNEKAATFIGWAPNEHDDIPAPDMTDPRNYMKALAKVAERRLVRLTVNSETSGVIWTKISIGVEIDEKSPVAALAALYDVEHAE